MFCNIVEILRRSKMLHFLNVINIVFFYSFCAIFIRELASAEITILKLLFHFLKPIHLTSFLLSPIGPAFLAYNCHNWSKL